MSSVRYYLNCPYAEKDQAKTLGARWDKQKQQWYVPNEKLTNIDDFNRWRPNGKVFLDCSFQEDKLAKNAGALWDPAIGRWYVTSQTGDIPTKFHRWLRIHPSQEHNEVRGIHGGGLWSTVHAVDDSSEDDDDYFSYMSVGYPGDFCSARVSTSISPPKKRKVKGNAKDDSTLRISEAMTVPQLQQECKFRGIKGFSAKSKDWLLNELEVGSIWQFHRHEHTSTKMMKKALCSKTKKEDSTKKTVKSVAKEVSSSNSTEKKKSDAVSSKEGISFTTAGALEHSTGNQKGVRSKKQLATKRAYRTPIRTPMSNELMSLPRVTSAMTVAQLSHELMKRHPETKGTSGKPKQWFLSLLGENSVWTTNPDIKISLEHARLVSKDLTVKQLVHEIMTRMPDTKGLSKKTKQELMTLAVEGSIWMTHDHGDSLN
jgi:hypothetical protein